MFWNSVQRGMTRPDGAMLFRPFDFFPVRPDFIHVFDLGFAKNMRMAADEFLDEHTADFLEIERSSFAGELAVKNDLQQQVAEFLGHLVVVARFDGVNQFINFLNRVAAQASCGSARGPTGSPWASAAAP